MYRCVFFFFCILGVLPASAEGGLPGDSLQPRGQTYPGRYLQFRYEKNFSMAFTSRSEIRDIYNSSPFTGVHARFGWEISRRSVYSGLYRRPVFGLGMMISTFQNESLGNPLAFYGFLQVPILANPGRWQFLYEIALGIAGNLNPYNEVKNPGNILIGSAVNAYITLGLEARYAINSQWQLGLGLGVKHMSNGAIKRPNGGVNILPVQLNLQYRLSGKPYTAVLGEPARYKPFYAFEISNMSGFKQIEPNDPLIFKNITSLQAGYQFSYKYRAGLALDITYTPAGVQLVQDDASALSKKFSAGVSGNWTWFITEQLYMPLSIGLYLHHNPEIDERKPYYQRVGLRYLFPKRHLSAGIGLKMHAGVADFVEFGVGWTFHKDPNQYRVPAAQ